MNIKMFLSCLIVLALVFSFYKNETVLAQSEESMEIDETSTDKIFGKTADDSFAIKDEKVEIFIENFGKGEKLYGMGVGSLLAIAPKAANYVLKRVVRHLNKRAEEYVQSYTANYRTGYDFWKNKKGEDGEINGKEVNLKQITIVRKGRTKKDKKGNIPVAETLVLQLAISPCPGGDPVFSFQPRYLLVSKTKAKRKEKDENIDITVDLQIQSAWIDSKQNAHNQVVASLSIPFKNIIVGETYSAETQSNDDWKMFVANHSTGWVFGVPVSTNIKGQITGNGVYSITAKVTEFDDYGERVYKKLAYFIDSNTDKVVGWIPSRD